ncbi:acyl carrier protein [Clostridioides difficile]|nr:acyl carrier protein [Clostridioides difficile]OMK38127.1 acyl carrier protein [Clostridioides difficile]
MFNKVVEIIIEQLGVEDKEITMETSLMKDLEADSLDAVEIIMALEDGIWYRNTRYRSRKLQIYRRYS